MKAFKKFILAILLLIVPIGIFSACNKSVEFKINFIVDNEVYDTISSTGNTTISMPDDPIKEGYTFDGWYWDNEVWSRPFTVNSLLDTPLVKDLRVYARFIEKNIKKIKLSFNYYYNLTDLSGCFDNAPNFMLFEKNIKLNNVPKIKDDYKKYILGWTDGEKLVKDGDVLSQDLTLSIVFNDKSYGIIRQTSGSMEPTLQIAKYYFYEKCGYDDLVLGDIVVMNYNSIYLVHRVVGKKIGFEIILPEDIRYNSSEAIWYTKGDVSDTSDGTIKEERVVGRISEMDLIPNSMLTEDFKLLSQGDETVLVEYAGNSENVIIPNEVTKINEYAFYGNMKLKTIAFEKNSKCKAIGARTFDNCTSLTSVYFSDLVAWLNIQFDASSSNPLSNGAQLYLNNQLVECLVIPNNMLQIKDYAFNNCTSLTSITIPESVTNIGNYAFYGCTSLKSVTIPENITNIGEFAFYNCSALEIINYNATNYVNLDLMKIVFGNAGKDGDGITVNIGVNVKIIPSGVFNNPCGDRSKIKTVIFQNNSNCENIEQEAFYGCNGLTSITIPNSVTSIGKYAFDNTSLTKVYYEGSESDWSSINIGSGNVELTNATRYYYSEEKPINDGNYWHYVDGVVTEWKKNEGEGND